MGVFICWQTKKKLFGYLFAPWRRKKTLFLISQRALSGTSLHSFLIKKVLFLISQRALFWPVLALFFFSRDCLNCSFLFLDRLEQYFGLWEEGGLLFFSQFLWLIVFDFFGLIFFWIYVRFYFFRFFSTLPWSCFFLCALPESSTSAPLFFFIRKALPSFPFASLFFFAPSPHFCLKQNHTFFQPLWSRYPPLHFCQITMLWVSSPLIPIFLILVAIVPPSCSSEIEISCHKSRNAPESPHLKMIDWTAIITWTVIVEKDDIMITTNEGLWAEQTTLSVRENKTITLFERPGTYVIKNTANGEYCVLRIPTYPEKLGVWLILGPFFVIMWLANLFKYWRPRS